MDMDRSGCFLKALSDKGLVEKGKEAEGGKKIQTKTHHAAGEKIDEPVVIWKSKKPRCFKRLGDQSRPTDVHYFSNTK